MARLRDSAAHSPWMDWVRQLISPDDPATAARRAGFDKSTMTRWGQGGSPDPERAVRLARAYGAHPVEALVVMGLITAEEGRFAPINAREVIRSARPEVLAGELVTRINMLSGTTSEDAEPWSLGDHETSESGGILGLDRQDQGT